ncbi:MAG: hypothetical protein SVK08_05955 [Halobacteriota archaeon]|nr:hypothetical protein [Halobacteriota archaeon]
MLIPLFPKLGMVDEVLAGRVEALYEKMKRGEVSESDVVEFVNNLTQSILKELIENPRVKHLFESKLPLLKGKKLSLIADGLNPWLVEVVEAPNVLEVKVSTAEEIVGIPGFSGDPDVMKKIISDSASVDLLSDAIYEERLKMVNASPEEPVTWIRDLFSMVGPVWDRTDMVESILKGIMPDIDDQLKSRGC